MNGGISHNHKIDLMELKFVSAWLYLVLKDWLKFC